MQITRCQAKVEMSYSYQNRNVRFLGSVNKDISSFLVCCYNCPIFSMDDLLKVSEVGYKLSGRECSVFLWVVQLSLGISDWLHYS